jgi:hypothetical protein
MNSENSGDVIIFESALIPETDMAANALEEAGIPFYRQIRMANGLTLAMEHKAPAPGASYLILVPEGSAGEAKTIVEGLFGPGEERTARTKYTRGTKIFLATLLFIMLAIFFICVLRMISGLFV